MEDDYMPTMSYLLEEAEKEFTKACVYFFISGLLAGIGINRLLNN